MPFIKLINEFEHKSYDGEQGLKNLIYYIIQPTKTTQDTVRELTVLYNYVGCEPFIYPRVFETDPDYVFDYLVTNNRIYNKSNVKDIMKHRVVSFSPVDYILPADAAQLGRKLITYYAQEGYIAAYAVHMDTYHIHLHIAVNTVSYVNGNRFHIYNEYNKVKSIVDTWFFNKMEVIDHNLNRKERYENTLFGDNIISYSKIGLDAKTQIWNAVHLL